VVRSGARPPRPNHTPTGPKQKKANTFAVFFLLRQILKPKKTKTSVFKKYLRGAQGPCVLI
ncbi:hypothetical protein, partial [Enterobacter intestinihominis]